MKPKEKPKYTGHPTTIRINDEEEYIIEDANVHKELRESKISDGEDIRDKIRELVANNFVAVFPIDIEKYPIEDIKTRGYVSKKETYPVPEKNYMKGTIGRLPTHSMTKKIAYAIVINKDMLKGLRGNVGKDHAFHGAVALDNPTLSLDKVIIIDDAMEVLHAPENMTVENITEEVARRIKDIT